MNTSGVVGTLQVPLKSPREFWGGCSIIFALFHCIFLFLAGDVSSISGSDSDSSDVSSESELPPSVSDTGRTPQIPRSHKVLLRNAKGQLISAYRCVLLTGKASHSPAVWGRESRKGGDTRV